MGSEEKRRRMGGGWRIASLSLAALVCLLLAIAIVPSFMNGATPEEADEPIAYDRMVLDDTLIEGIDEEASFEEDAEAPLDEIPGDSMEEEPAPPEDENELVDDSGESIESGESGETIQVEASEGGDFRRGDFEASPAPTEASQVSWDARTVEAAPVVSEHEPDVVLVSIGQGADAATLTASLEASGCVSSVQVTEEDIANGYVKLEVNEENGYDLEHAMLQLQTVPGVEHSQPNFIYHLADDVEEPGEIGGSAETGPSEATGEESGEGEPTGDAAGGDGGNESDSADGQGENGELPTEGPSEEPQEHADEDNGDDSPREAEDAGQGADQPEGETQQEPADESADDPGKEDTAENPEEPSSSSSSESESEEDEKKKMKAQSAATNDPDLDEQWMLDSVHAPEAWEKVKTNNRVTVAMFDTGCTVEHEDLADNVVAAYDATGESGTGDISDIGHGTHVAGIISAVANNEKGIAGVSYNANVASVQIFVGDEASSEAIADAYDWVMENASLYNIRVVNLSVSAPIPDDEASAYEDVLLVRKARAADDMGILTICAAGNDAKTQGGAYISYPCDYLDFAMGVIALENGTPPTRAEYSNYNRPGETTKDISAPGSSIFSTDSDSASSYNSLDGTSFAAPCVSGIAAMVFAADPSLAPEDVKGILCSNATRLGGSEWDVQYGFGEVNAAASVNSLAYLDGQSAMFAGGSLTLSPSIAGDWSWSSSDDGVASVNGGVVSGNTGGSAIITATNGSVTLSKAVTVYDVSFEGENEVAVDHSIQIGFNENPDTGMWILESADTGVATIAITGNGITVYGIGPGETQITATLSTNRDLVVSYPMTVVDTGERPFVPDDPEVNAGLSVSWPAGFAYDTANKKYVYTGSALKPVPSKIEYTGYSGETTALVKGTDYTISYENNVDSSPSKDGSGKVTITGVGSYVGSVTYTFYIWQRAISDSTVTASSPAAQYYTGKPLTPKPTVKHGKTVLVEGTDYALTYANNTKVGTATITVKGKGNYSGSRKVTFAIIEKPKLAGPAKVYAASTTTYTVTNGSIAIKSRSGAADAQVSGKKLIAGKKAGSVVLSLRDSKGREYATKTVNIVNVSGYWVLASAAGTSYVIDIAGGSLVNGGNVQVYTSNGSLAQKFVINLNSDSTYTIKSAKTGKVLDVANGSAADGANIQQYKSNGSNAQKWTLLMDANGKVTFVNKASGKALDIAGGKAGNGKSVQQYKSNGTNAQKWVMKQVNTDTGPVYSGQYRVSTAVNTGFVLDVTGASKSNGANVQLYSSNSSNAQRWNMEYLGNGIYKITCANSGLALDVAGGSTANGANVQQYAWNGSNAQKWKLKKNSDGSYTFVNVASGKVLDVAGGQAANGRNVQQYSSNGTKAQMWKLGQY